jgi:hypothetical protein
MSNNYDSLIASQSAQHIEAVVGRIVIDDDDLKFLERLIQQAVDRCSWRLA